MQGSGPTLGVLVPAPSAHTKPQRADSSHPPDGGRPAPVGWLPRQPVGCPLYQPVGLLLRGATVVGCLLRQPVGCLLRCVTVHERSPLWARSRALGSAARLAGPERVVTYPQEPGSKRLPALLSP